MDRSVKAVFDDECADLQIDSKLVQKIGNYQTRFVHKNDDHATFFGGKLLGVQVVRFTEADHATWFEEIIQADDTPLEERLLALPEINPDWNVSSDVMNLSCVWLTHSLNISKRLTPEQRHAGMIDTLLVLQYKFLTSRLYRHFKYPADKDTAQAAYAQLSYKFAIKQYDNWLALLIGRAEEILSPNGIHRHTIEFMDSDRKVMYMLNDIQGRIRDMLKNIYDVFINAHKQGDRVSSVSSVVEYDGVEVLKDKSKNLTGYTRYINSIISDKNSFVRQELLPVVEKMMNRAPPRLIIETLNWMSENYRRQGADVIEDILNETLIHSFDYVAENKTSVRSSTDLPALLTRLKGIYMSSRSNDPALKQLREKVAKAVQIATGNRSEAVIASVRTSVMLYIVLRALTMKYYSTSM